MRVCHTSCPIGLFTNDLLLPKADYRVKLNSRIDRILQKRNTLFKNKVKGLPIAQKFFYVKMYLHK